MQLFADAQIILKTDKAIKKRATDGVVMADLLGEFGKPGFSDFNSFLPQSFFNSQNQIDPGFPVANAGNAYSVSINGLSFMAFLPDGTCRLGAAAEEQFPNAKKGFFLTAREAVLDSKIGANAGNLDGGNTDQNWTAVSGTWDTFPKLTPDGGTFIGNTGSHEIAVARTTGTIPANRAHRLDISLLNLKRSGKSPFFRHFFGNAYCLILQNGLKPTIARVTYNASGMGGVLQTIRTFNSLPTIRTGGGVYRVYIFRVGGRLCISLSGQTVWLYDAQNGAANGPQGAAVRDFAWLEAPWQMELQNVRARVEYAVLKYSTAAGVKLTGSLTRAMAKAVSVDPAAGAAASRAGWILAGTRADVTPTVSENSVSYTLTLTGGPDGIDTPFVDRAVVRYAPTWTNPIQDSIDVRGACDNLSLQFVAPPDAAGAQGTVTLDRNLLDLQFPGGAWQAYAKMWNPVTINVRRAGTAYTKLFQGYIMKPTFTSGLGSERKLTLVVRDPIMRLQKLGECHNALIDHDYPPLDLFFARKFTDNNAGYDASGHPINGTLYIAECVQEILRIALGDDVANSLNGTGAATRFLPEFHPALISTRNDTAGWSSVEAIGSQSPPVSAGGWLAPPPFGSAAYDWIMELAQRDRCVFYYGWLDGTNSDWPVPIYGRLERILAASQIPLHLLPDTASGADWSRLLQSMEIERRPERDVNVATVWGPTANGLEGILPSLSIGSAALPVSDPRSAARTWPRQLLVRDNIALLGAQVIADGIIGLLTGVDLIWPNFNFEGDERVGLGHLVKPFLNGVASDATAGIPLAGNGPAFRVERVDHIIDFNRDSGSYRMNVWPRPLTSGEIAGFDNRF